MTDKKVMIEVKDLWKSFGDVEVLKGVNATFYEGETVAIIGASGVTLKYGITDYNYMMSLILKKIIARAKSITVVADSSKFGISDPGITCPLSMVNTIITDSNRKDVIMEEFEEYRQRLVFAEDIMPSGENPFEEHTDLTQQLLS